MDDLPAWLAAKHHEAPCYDDPRGGGEKDALDKAAILSMRREHCSAAQSVSYANRDPLLIVRGRGSKLYDEAGKEYLDTRNNVGHVGHSHPRVVAAVAAQAAAINTNTRYLHPNHVRLAHALLKRCPRPLERVFFVNSGSEANDLALRLARTYTGKRDVIVVEDAYHGHTGDVIDISPYKFAHVPGGTGQRPWVHVVPAPDTYRGAFRGADAAHRYAEAVEDAVRAASSRGALGGQEGEGSSEEQPLSSASSLPASSSSSSSTPPPGLSPPPSAGLAAFFIESGMSVAGVILPPPGYLARCYRAVRAAGGLCVADEVQVGFGRFGSSFWGFQASSSSSSSPSTSSLGGGGGAEEEEEEEEAVVPDIVTMGKPFGNGMPLAAVVTTAAVAAAFENGLEYFNTFGGNPVCCAAGLAVLAALEDEDLPASAAAVGAFLVAEFRRLAEAHALIGDVRGRGLFVGVDFVKDRATREPAPNEVSAICSALKEKHAILTSIDGPHENVLVVKPPLAFSLADAARFVAALDDALSTLGPIDPNAARTPT